MLHAVSLEFEPTIRRAELLALIERAAAPFGNPGENVVSRAGGGRVGNER